jgi:hypothetical protein
VQLDLFDSARPPAVVHVFPLHRRADLVRKIAAALNVRSYSAGQRYWSLHVKQERAKLARAGFSPNEVDAEISRYATAISRVLHLQKQYSSTPDSAA